MKHEREESTPSPAKEQSLFEKAKAIVDKGVADISNLKKTINEKQGRLQAASESLASLPTLKSEYDAALVSGDEKRLSDVLHERSAINQRKALLEDKVKALKESIVLDQESLSEFHILQQEYEKLCYIEEFWKGQDENNKCRIALAKSNSTQLQIAAKAGLLFFTGEMCEADIKIALRDEPMRMVWSRQNGGQYINADTGDINEMED